MCDALAHVTLVSIDRNWNTQVKTGQHSKAHKVNIQIEYEIFNIDISI